jgi:hypothetical protein
VADRDVDLPEKQRIACRQGNSFLILKNGQFADIP